MEDTEGETGLISTVMVFVDRKDSKIDGTKMGDPGLAENIAFMLSFSAKVSYRTKT